MNKIRASILIVFIAVHLISWGQTTPINSIDKVFIERESRDPSEPAILDLDKNPVIDRDVIVFDMPGLGDYLGETTLSIADVTLMIEGMELKEFPAFIEDSESGLVKFTFYEDDLTDEHRQKIYDSKGEELKELLVGIKIGNDTVLTYFPKVKFYFERIRYWGRVGIGLIGGFILFFFLLVVFFPGMLKADLASAKAELSPGDIAALGPSEIDAIRGAAAYSFGKTQMVFWTFIIVASFIYIWGFTGHLNSLNNTALILLGISSFTVAASTLANKKDEENAKKNVISAKTLEDNRKTTGRWLLDILSEGNSVSIHRVQAFVFNLIFGIAFLKTVIADYAMPTFDETQLILLGLSNGTYAFLKTTENK